MDFLDLRMCSLVKQSSYFMTCCSINHNLSTFMTLRLYWLITLATLIFSPNQWAGYCMIGIFFMKELNETVE